MSAGRAAAVQLECDPDSLEECDPSNLQSGPWQETWSGYQGRDISRLLDEKLVWRGTHYGHSLATGWARLGLFASFTKSELITACGPRLVCGDDGDLLEKPVVEEMTCEQCSAEIEVTTPPGELTNYEVECFRCNRIAKTIVRLDPPPVQPLADDNIRCPKKPPPRERKKPLARRGDRSASDTSDTDVDLPPPSRTGRGHLRRGDRSAATVSDTGDTDTALPARARTEPGNKLASHATMCERPEMPVEDVLLRVMYPRDDEVTLYKPAWLVDVGFRQGRPPYINVRLLDLETLQPRAEVVTIQLDDVSERWFSESEIRRMRLDTRRWGERREDWIGTSEIRRMRLDTRRWGERREDWDGTREHPLELLSRLKLLWVEHKLRLREPEVLKAQSLRDEMLYARAGYGVSGVLRTSKLELVFLEHLRQQNSWPTIVIDDEPDSRRDELLCAGQASVHTALGRCLQDDANVEAAVSWLLHAPLEERQRWAAVIASVHFADWGDKRASADHLLGHLLGTHPGGDDSGARNDRRLAFTQYIDQVLRPVEDTARGTSQTGSAKRPRTERRAADLVAQRMDHYRRDMCGKYSSTRCVYLILDALANMWRKRGIISVDDYMDRNEICSICLEPLTQKKMARVEPCRHWFHLACLQEYVDKMQLSRCPLCRDELTGSVTTANPSDP